ncbi:MAG TPA: EAL domain-containing protein [Terracidiphilus sp.]|nr:EAL domain-containing protein [Terracidiphilus sp.]
MRCPSPIEDEKGRLLALAEYGLSEEDVLPELQPIVLIAARMLGMPVAAINMIGSDHVFFAASFGIGECDMRRDVSFCAHAITQDDVFVVPDAALDERFHDNPLVTSGAIRFYAGIPLLSPSRHALGALCVIDTAPRPMLSPQDRELLRDLARMTSDKLELRRLECARQTDRFTFENIAQTSPAPIACFDAGLRITFWNAAAARLFGYPANEAIGQSLPELLAGGDQALTAIMRELSVAPSTPAEWPRCEVIGCHKDGSTLPLEASFFGWTENGRRNLGTLLADISERRRHEHELTRITNYDPLTGMANREMLRRILTEELAKNSPLAVLTIDLDNFSEINNTLGVTTGDRILAIVAERTRNLLRPIDTVARISGDEFAVLLARVGNATRACAFANDLLAEIAQPFCINGEQVRLTASCGIAVSPENGRESEQLLSNADLALYQAKIAARGHAFVYAEQLREQATERRQCHSELHQALEDREFVLYYQPQVRTMDGAIVGAEALLRWNHPTRGLLTPGAFLPVLCASSLSGSVGDWILETACAQLHKWHSEFGNSLRMGVNLFPAQIAGGRLQQRVAELLVRYNLPPSSLELEITENIVLGKGTSLLDPLQELHRMGVSLAFDDFGTGYASLSLLKSFPLSRLKIDQSFVRNLCTSRQDRGTVAAAIELARAHDLLVIAEGVETAEQHVQLATMHCDEMQGYLFGKPMPADDFTARLCTVHTPVNSHIARLAQ